MNSAFEIVDGKPVVVRHEHVNLGLAVDVEKTRRLAHAARPERQGSRHPRLRGVLTPRTRRLIGKVRIGPALARRLRRHHRHDHEPRDDRHGALGAAPHARSGLHHRRRRDRLPRRVRGRRPGRRSRDSASARSITLTNTYDHRIIKGAESGEFLARDPRPPARRATTSTTTSSRASPCRTSRRGGAPTSAALDDEPAAQSREGRRTSTSSSTCTGCAATSSPTSTRSAAKEPQTHPELDITHYGLTIWDLDREFPIGSLGAGTLGRTACRCATSSASSATPTRARRRRVHAHPGARPEGVDPGTRRRRRAGTPSRDEKRRILERLNAAEAFERFLHTKYLGQKRFSLEGAESAHPDARRAAVSRRRRRRRTRSCSAWRTAAGSTCSRTWSASAYGADLPRVRGRARPAVGAGLGRREVPRRRDRQARVAGGQRDRGHARRRTRATSRPSTRSSRAWPAPRSDQQGDRERRTGAAGARARRRRVRGPGRRRRDAQPLRGAGLRGRRHRARRREQPARVHHRAGARPVERVRDRRRQDGAGADLPRERRRPRGVRPGDAARVRVPADVPQGRRRRHGLLPAVRPQRGRRARVHAAARCTSSSRRIRRRASSTPRRSCSAATSPPTKRAARRRGLPGPPRRRVRARRTERAPDASRAATPDAPSEPRLPAPSPIRRSRRDRRRALDARAGRRRARSPRPTASRATRSSSASSQAHRVAFDEGRGRLGARRGASPSGRLCSRARPCASPARTPGGARSASATACSSTSDTEDGVLPARAPRAATRRRSCSTTRCSPSTPRSGFEYGYSVAVPGGARRLGSAVRRLRQRRADHHRPVHRRRRGQVGPASSARAAPPPRLRGSGPRALERADRALPHAVRRGQPAGRLPDDRGAVLPRAAPPGAGARGAMPLVCFTPKRYLRMPQTPLAGRRSSPTAGSSSSRRPRPTLDRDAVRRVLLCTGKIGHELMDRRDELGAPGRGRAGRAALPVARGRSILAIARPRTRTRGEVWWVQEEPANMGAWNFVHGRLAPDRCATGPSSATSRGAASASPASGSQSARPRAAAAPRRRVRRTPRRVDDLRELARRAEPVAAGRRRACRRRRRSSGSCVMMSRWKIGPTSMLLIDADVGVDSAARRGRRRGGAPRARASPCGRLRNLR